MRLITYSHSRFETSRLGVTQGDRVLDAAALLSLTDQPLASPDILTLLDGGPALLDHLREAAARFATEYSDALQTPTDLALPAWEVRLHAPLPQPRSFRDFSGFEQHQAAAFAKRNRPVPSVWYEVPVFSYGHTGNLFGPDSEIPKPSQTDELDFELELACVIGVGGRDIAAAGAEAHILGYTILNDWSARDLQRQELPLGLGPAKGKDFATSIGPAIVTGDELADRRDAEGRLNLTMIARINGDEVSRANTNQMYWSFTQMIERASRDVDLLPGDLIGSGTAGTGCLFELGTDVHPWLEPGDEVELEIEGLGRLRNVIGSPS